MTIFSNRAINRLQLHFVIATFAQGAGGVFVFVYMLRQGVSAPLVFCAIAAINACRFLLRPMVLPLGRRIGLGGLLLLGTVGESVIYPMLGFLHGPGGYLWLVVAVSSVGSVLYWTSYHAYFAALGEAGTRGAQVGLRTAMTSLVNVAAPALGGMAMTALGPATAFDVIAGVQLLAAAPLIGAPDLAVADEPREGRREYLHGALLQSTDGWLAAGFVYVWQVALFITLGERYAAYGGAMALAGVLGALASLGVGNLIDLGHGRRSTILAYGLTNRGDRIPGCEHRAAGRGPRRQRPGRLRWGAVRAGDDGQGLQPRQGLAVSVAFPHRHRRRLGYRQRARLPRLRGPNRARRPARRLRPHRASRRGRRRGDAGDRLWPSPRSALTRAATVNAGARPLVRMRGLEPPRELAPNSPSSWRVYLVPPHPRGPHSM